VHNSSNLLCSVSIVIWIVKRVLFMCHRNIWLSSTLGGHVIYISCMYLYQGVFMAPYGLCSQITEYKMSIWSQFIIWKLGCYLAIMHQVKCILCVSIFQKIEDLCLGSDVIHLFGTILPLPEVQNTLCRSYYYGHIKALTQDRKALSIGTVPVVVIQYLFYSPTVCFLQEWLTGSRYFFNFVCPCIIV